jgi:hypothetical protein
MTNTEQKSTHWLADKFNTQREIIEAAETPFSKLAMFVLPVISPMVPATMTGMHLYQVFLDVFKFSGSEYLSGGLAIASGLVLELLGYVGAVTFIKSAFNYFSTYYTEYIVPLVLNSISYLFYLILLWMINYQLGDYLGVNPTLNNIIATLSFITVPTSLLAGSHLSEKSWTEKHSEEERKKLDEVLREQEHQDMLRREELDRQDKARQADINAKLERARIKRGLVTPVVYQQDSQGVSQEFQNSFGTNAKTGRPSIYETAVFGLMSETYETQGKVLTFKEVVQGVSGISDATASKLRNRWIEQEKARQAK